MRNLLAAQLFLAVAAPIHAAFTWENVHIGGGGGFIPGIVFHPTAKNVTYARADIGGLYRMNNDDSWTPITDSITTEAGWHNWGIDALALDPQNPDMVYAAVGMYTNSWDPNNGAIIRSSDRGDTWSFSNLTFKVGGNMPGRGTGERLAVDPANSDILYFGARSGHGLWKSTDGGVTFTNVTTFTNTGTYREDPTDTTGYESDIMGLTFVTFDSTSGTTDGATSRIFVGVADNITASVYVSENAGATWAPLAGQPGTYFPHKCKLQPTEKALYLSYSDGIGPYDGTLGAVWRYDLANATWTDITPVSGSNLYFGFGGIGVDMLNPGTIVVAALNSWWPNGQIFRSNDSGTTWSQIWEWTSYPNMNNYYSQDVTNAPWIYPGFIVGSSTAIGWMMEALEIDPLDSDHWLYGTGLTLWGGHDLTKWDTVHNVTIQVLANGIEEMSVQGLASIPSGTELLAAVGDNDGFTFKSASDLQTSPQTNWMTPEWTTASGVDYAGNEPANVVRVGDASGSGVQQVALSTDGGNTWSIDYGASTTDYGGTVAFSAGADTVLWSSSTSGVLRSQYQGTFATVASLPSGAVIASDKRNESYFYAASGSTFYVSADTGSTFAKGGALSGVSTINYIAVHPTTAGEVWASTNAGLFVSTDYGASFTAAGAGTLTNTQQVAFGVGSGSSAWYLYAFGNGPAGAALYASADSGASWTNIQGSQGFGDISSCKLAGSGNVAGQVYVGTNGRGVFYASGTVTGSTGSSTSTSTVKTTVSSSSSSATSVKTTTATKATTTATTATTTSTKTTSSTTSTSTAVAQEWDQCGGIGWIGPTTCVAPYTCVEQNPYYSQCVPST